MVAAKRYHVILAVPADAQADAELALAIETALLGIGGVDTLEIDATDAMGLSARDQVVSVSLAFSVSVAANIATPQIEAALNRMVEAGRIVIEHVLPDATHDTDQIGP